MYTIRKRTNTLRSARLRGRASGREAHRLPSYNKHRKKCGKNLLSLRQVYTGVQRRVRLLLSLSLSAIRLPFVFLHPFSPPALGHRRASFFPSRPVARSALLFSPPIFDHRRCCQTTTCAPGPGQLPSCGHPFPSIFLSLSLCSRVKSPPSALNSLPSALALFILTPLSILSSVLLLLLFFPFSSFLSTPGGASTAVRHVLLQRFPQCCIVIISTELYRPNPLPVQPMMHDAFYQFPRR